MLLAGALAPPAAAANIVILDSNVAEIAPGEVVSDQMAVIIPAGAAVTIILASGETRVISGPYDGAIGAAEAVGAASIGEFTRTRGGETKVLGAVRAPQWEFAD